MAKHTYCRHSAEIEVPFFDVDVMQIVWHGHYVKYLEVARCAFLDALGYGASMWLASAYLKYSELNLNQYSVGSPCRTICTVCGSPPCPDFC